LGSAFNCATLASLRSTNRSQASSSKPLTPSLNARQHALLRIVAQQLSVAAPAHCRFEQRRGILGRQRDYELLHDDVCRQLVRRCPLEQLEQIAEQPE